MQCSRGQLPHGAIKSCLGQTDADDGRPAYRQRQGVRLLEIGVWYGKSLAMFADYFDDGSHEGSATVIGVDTNLSRWKAREPELEDEPQPYL